jgi:hypothetical protein
MEEIEKDRTGSLSGQPSMLTWHLVDEYHSINNKRFNGRCPAGLVEI